MRLELPLGVAFALAGCGSSPNPLVLSTGVVFDNPDSGLCTVAPLLDDGGPTYPTHEIELDPAFNPNPTYTLSLMLVNNAAVPNQVACEGGNGNTIVPGDCGDDDFHMDTANVSFSDVEGRLVPEPTTTFIEGVVRAGGLRAATVVQFPIVTTTTIASWQTTFQASGFSTEHLVVLASIAGTLGSGQVVTTATIDVPLTVCFDCGGVSPVTGCPSGTFLAPSGEGPCCAPQDFTDVCTSCGAEGQPCCASDAGTGACAGSLTCTGPAPEPLAACGYPHSPSATCIAGT